MCPDCIPMCWSDYSIKIDANNWEDIEAKFWEGRWDKSNEWGPDGFLISKTAALSLGPF
jgi:hypothetical protein